MTWCDDLCNLCTPFYCEEHHVAMWSSLCFAVLSCCPDLLYSVTMSPVFHRRPLSSALPGQGLREPTCLVIIVIIIFINLLIILVIVISDIISSSSSSRTTESFASAASRYEVDTYVRSHQLHNRTNTAIDWTRAYIQHYNPAYDPSHIHNDDLHHHSHSY